jgi:hypothetical protein
MKLLTASNESASETSDAGDHECIIEDPENEDNAAVPEPPPEQNLDPFPNQLVS